MQWLSLWLWSTLTVYGARRPGRLFVTRALLGAGLALSMLSQLWLLRLDGLLSLATGLPLHLCGMMGVLSVPMLVFSPRWLCRFALLLGAPCAFLALCFPAVIASSAPITMSLAFNRLHALILCAAFLCNAKEKPSPRDARASFLVGNGYLVLVAALNRVLNTNYLFLRAPPLGTPLEWFFARGNAFYLCALELGCMVVIRLMLSLATAKNRSGYSPCNRCTSPCTTPRREQES